MYDDPQLTGSVAEALTARDVHVAVVGRRDRRRRAVRPGAAVRLVAVGRRHRLDTFTTMTYPDVSTIGGFAQINACSDRVSAALRPHATGGSFLNFLHDPSRTRTAYTEPTYRRLA